jgi:hypothetical protein
LSKNTLYLGSPPLRTSPLEVPCCKSRLARLLSTFIGAKLRERVLEPALADLRHERRIEILKGKRWKAIWVSIKGLWALLSAIVLARFVSEKHWTLRVITKVAEGILLKYRQRKKSRTSMKTPLLDTWALLLPFRVANEDLGDYIEVLHHLKAQNAPAWKVYLRTFTAIFWTGINAIGYLLKTLSRLKVVN